MVILFHDRSSCAHNWKFGPSNWTGHSGIVEWILLEAQFGDLHPCNEPPIFFPDHI